MTNFEEIMIKAFIVNSKYNSALITQNNAQGTVNASMMLALEILLQKTDPENAKLADLLGALKKVTETTESIKESIDEITLDMNEIQALVLSMGGPSLDIKGFNLN